MIYLFSNGWFRFKDPKTRINGYLCDLRGVGVGSNPNGVEVGVTVKGGVKNEKSIFSAFC
jgi:hypothetical protein